MVDSNLVGESNGYCAGRMVYTGEFNDSVPATLTIPGSLAVGSILWSFSPVVTQLDDSLESGEVRLRQLEGVPAHLERMFLQLMWKVSDYGIRFYLSREIIPVESI